jgi:hypothetical protein
MKMMMVLVPSECLQGVQDLIEQHDIHAYSEIPNVLGAGRGGRKLGTRAFPGTSAMLLVLTEPSGTKSLIEALKLFSQEQNCTSGIRVFAVPAESVL